MIEKLHLSEKDREIIHSIIEKYKPDFEFFAFGSRVKGSHKKYSDLDLAFVNNNQQGFTKLKHDFEDSDLSITVDLVDLKNVSEDFASLIHRESIPI